MSTITPLHYTGFDFYTTGLITQIMSQVTNVNGTVTVESGGRNGGQRLNLQAGGGVNTQAVRKITSSTFTEFVIGAAIDIVGNNLTWGILGALEGGTNHLNVALSSASPYSLIVRRGTTVLATIAAGLLTGAWYYVELAGKIDDTVGYWEVYVNGVSVGSASGVDTRNGGTGVCDRYELGSSQDNSGTNVTRVLFDDAYCATVTGGPDHLGDVRCAYLKPTAAGASTQWTPSAGSNWQNVDDQTPNGDTDYNSDATVGDIDTFVMEDMPSNGAVFGVQRVLYARKTDAGSRTLHAVIRPTTVNREGPDLGLSDSYLYGTDIMLTNPDTGLQWDDTEVNASEIGYKLQA